MAKNAEKRNEFFEDLKAGLSAAIEHAEGKRKGLRITTLSASTRATISDGDRKSSRRTARAPNKQKVSSLDKAL